MQLKKTFTLTLTLFLTACIQKGPNPIDPYESSNRKIYDLNQRLDKVTLKPLAKLYKKILPNPVQAGINNVYSNINLFPTIANDLLQADLGYTLKDTWRLIINSTLGVGGIFDPATSCGLPRHTNDLGLTFAKWGDKQSPYIVIPLLGPSTIRDGMGLLFDTVFTPYFYIPQDAIIWGILGVRFVDLRAQMLDTEKLMDESLDRYAFMRDAYLQNRNYLISGKQEASEELYVEGND